MGKWAPRSGARPLAERSKAHYAERQRALSNATGASSCYSSLQWLTEPPVRHRSLQSVTRVPSPSHAPPACDGSHQINFRSAETQLNCFAKVRSRTPSPLLVWNINETSINVKNFKAPENEMDTSSSRETALNRILSTCSIRCGVAKRRNTKFL